MRDIFRLGRKPTLANSRTWPISAVLSADHSSSKRS